MNGFLNHGIGSHCQPFCIAASQHLLPALEINSAKKIVMSNYFGMSTVLYSGSKVLGYRLSTLVGQPIYYNHYMKATLNDDAPNQGRLTSLLVHSVHFLRCHEPTPIYSQGGGHRYCIHVFHSIPYTRSQRRPGPSQSSSLRPYEVRQMYRTHAAYADSTVHCGGPQVWNHVEQRV